MTTLSTAPLWLIPAYAIALITGVVGAGVGAVAAVQAVRRWLHRRGDRAEFQRNTYTPAPSPAPDLGRLTVRSRPAAATPPVPEDALAGGVAPHTAADRGCTPEPSRSAAFHHAGSQA